MRATTSSGCSSTVARLAATRPWRSTTTRSASRNTCSMRCEMRRTPQPGRGAARARAAPPCASRRRRGRRSARRGPAAGIGRAGRGRWRASGAARPTAGWRAGAGRRWSTPSSSSSARAATCISASESQQPPPSSRPRKRLATASRFSQSARSCHTTPTSRPSAGQVHLAGVRRRACRRRTGRASTCRRRSRPPGRRARRGARRGPRRSSTTWRPKRLVRPADVAAAGPARWSAAAAAISGARYCPSPRHRRRQRWTVKSSRSGRRVRCQYSSRLKGQFWAVRPVAFLYQLFTVDTPHAIRRFSASTRSL